MIKKYKIEDLSPALQKLQRSKSEDDFFGITSNGIDCIYFIKANDNFNIEFEVMDEEQKSFFRELERYAENHDLPFILTTKNNQPLYKSDDPAPVIRFLTNSSIDRTIDIAKDIQETIFTHNSETFYNIVP